MPAPRAVLRELHEQDVKQRKARRAAEHAAHAEAERLVAEHAHAKKHVKEDVKVEEVVPVATHAVDVVVEHPVVVVEEMEVTDEVTETATETKKHKSNATDALRKRGKNQSDKE